MPQPDSEIQAEIQVLETVLSALAPLDEATRRRVLGYVQQRFGVPSSEAPPPVPASQPTTSAEGAVPEARPVDQITDIRTLRERKQPKSAVEMAVLVAYYLSEIAKPPEHKGTIRTADITKYFKQADYRLPTQPNVTLHRAKNAGYLDTATRGQYSLNPVGYNLVMHGLPRTGAETKASARRSRSGRKASQSKKTVTRAKARTQKKTAPQTKPRQASKKS
jgi:hypothetical protein